VPTAGDLRSVFRGCLLGGAVGDAIGAGIEFLSLAAIQDRFGPGGVTGYVTAYGRVGAITDDTQMTLFTAEGLIRARLAGTDEAVVTGVIWQAYQRWLSTQYDAGPPDCPDGWLVGQGFLHHSRSPGVTCTSALQGARPGSPQQPVNASKGCGGVMRVAPAGLVAADPFAVGCAAAALTHGHPSGYLAAGAFALIVSEVAGGQELARAVASAMRRLDSVAGGEPVRAALAEAVRRAAARPGHRETLIALGQGWVADEALAMAVYCALPAAAFRPAILLAANHGGDSDSTAAICGNLLGAALGPSAIDADLLDDLEGRDAIERVADDLYDLFVTGQAPADGRYPRT
jgi:ADP-ribosylglycohydrolase